MLLKVFYYVRKKVFFINDECLLYYNIGYVVLCSFWFFGLYFRYIGGIMVSGVINNCSYIIDKIVIIYDII